MNVCLLNQPSAEVLDAVADSLGDAFGYPPVRRLGISSLGVDNLVGVFRTACEVAPLDRAGLLAFASNLDEQVAEDDPFGLNEQVYMGSLTNLYYERLDRRGSSFALGGLREDTAERSLRLRLIGSSGLPYAELLRDRCFMGSVALVRFVTDRSAGRLVRRRLARQPQVS